MQPDLVAIVESIYDIEVDASSWISRILERLAPWIGDGVGLFGFAYSVSPELRVLPGAFGAFDCAPEALSVLPAAATLHDPHFIRRAYVDADLAVASEIEGWHGSEGRAYAVGGGISDVWGIVGRNPGNRGCGLFINRRDEAGPAAIARPLLVRIAAHVAAAHRLRERIGLADATERAEAIISPDGRVEHAVGLAEPRTARDELRAAALSLDRARVKLRKDPELALDTWKCLVSARWTLVDCFENDGRRYILAQENEPDPHAAPELSARERQVLANAALGRSNKEIAYALGLAHSTVRVLLARAARKLNATSRRELVSRYEALALRGAPAPGNDEG